MSDLDVFVGALALPFEEVNGYVRDSDAGPGWSMFLDVDRCPFKALPWLAQIVGVTLPSDVTDGQARALIRATGGFQRGTVAAIRGAAQPLLTGTQTVIVEERTDSAYTLTVITYTSETPDPAAVEAAIRAQKPAGLVLTYLNVAGQTYRELLTNHPTYQDVLDTYSTYRDVRDDTP